MKTTFTRSSPQYPIAQAHLRTLVAVMSRLHQPTMMVDMQDWQVAFIQQLLSDNIKDTESKIQKQFDIWMSINDLDVVDCGIVRFDECIDFCLRYIQRDVGVIVGPYCYAFFLTEFAKLTKHQQKIVRYYSGDTTLREYQPGTSQRNLYTQTMNKLRNIVVTTRRAISPTKNVLVFAYGGDTPELLLQIPEGTQSQEVEQNKESSVFRFLELEQDLFAQASVLIERTEICCILIDSVITNTYLLKQFASMTYLVEVCVLSEEYIDGLRGMGVRAREELSSVLKSLGLQLGMTLTAQEREYLALKKHINT